AYLEVLADLLGSAGVLLAGVVIATTGWVYVDPLVAVAVGLFILPRTWKLGRAAVRILVQAAPAHVDVTAVRAALAAVPGVCDVHDLHVWTLASGMDVTSAHLTLAPRTEVGPVLSTARARLHEDFAIDHATLQIEPAEAEGVCQPVSW
ncbi:MAG TPA: cation diffusion facilitator family transporter, partial [Micromonosporaceae bacterium]|nr:cation diffusion facilitator family transporter [Micromonosporaceae bacterium]